MMLNPCNMHQSKPMMWSHVIGSVTHCTGLGSTSYNVFSLAKSDHGVCLAKCCCRISSWYRYGE